MPWKRAKALPPPDNTLFEACFRIQREACEAAGRYIPLVVENVKGAQRWVGRAAWHYGSFYLWGDVPALMGYVNGTGIRNATKGTGGSWFTPNADDRSKPGHWKEAGCVTRVYNSKDLRRRAASAQIAKIPFPLAEHIARCFKPAAR